MQKENSGASESAKFTRRLFEPRQVYDERVAGRYVVYLDHNVWIDLRDAPTSVSRDCATLCRNLVESNRAVFPLSHGAVTELLQVPDDDARRRQALLMDALSQAVTFRTPEEIYALEAQCGYQFIMHGRRCSAQRNEMFSRAPDHYGTGKIAFSSEWTAEKADRFMELLMNAPELGSLLWMVEHLDLEDFRKRHAAYDAIYVKKMTAQRLSASAAFRRGGKIDRSRVLFEERAALFKRYVMKNLTQLALAEFGPESASVEIERRGNGSPQRTEKVFQASMPALELTAQVMADLTMNPSRKTRPQDNWDFEHAAVAPIYADVFVTSDRWLLDRLDHMEALVGHRRARLLRSTAELAGWARAALA